MKTFQKPLSAQEEAKYLSQMRGAKEEAVEARRILIERNLRLVAHVAKKYQNSFQDMEDLIATGAIGLIKAVDTFDETKGSRLATYALRCIDNELLMMFRAQNKTSSEVSPFDPIGTDKEGNEIHLMDVIEQQQPDIVECIETGRNIKKLLVLIDNQLTDRERQILILRYGLQGNPEATQNEIGTQLGISRSYVSRIEKKALQKLRVHFSG